MTTIMNNNQLFENKPGARYTVVKDSERKERQLNKYLAECHLDKQINPECKPKKSELIENMYEEKKVMKTKTCKREGAKEFNFKKQSALKVITNTKSGQKGHKVDLENRVKGHKFVDDNENVYL